MNHRIQRIKTILNVYSINPIRVLRAISRTPSFFCDYFYFKKQIQERRDVDFNDLTFYPMLDDKYSPNGSTETHYFIQDLFVAQKIFARNPIRHIDVGSRMDGFVAHVAAFRSIEVADIRPMVSKIQNINYFVLDLTRNLPDGLKKCCDSLSCLHVLEHFGLGRYGDPLMDDGHIIGLNNLMTMLKTGGTLYLSVPIGPQRVEFNAHRVFSVRYLLELFKENLLLRQFSYIDDHGNLNSNINLDNHLIDTNCGCRFGCGIFELEKR
jgi:hypothetical protein